VVEAMEAEEEKGEVVWEAGEAEEKRYQAQNMSLFFLFPPVLLRLFRGFMEGVRTRMGRL
jgi:hypothetical protein